MKKTYILFITFIIFSITINAQEKKKGKEKIRALKIAYLTEKLDLSADEAEKFWPLFNAYQKERRALYKFEKKALKERGEENYNTEAVTDKEAEDVLQRIYENREKRHENKNAFHEKLAKFLSPKKMLTLEVVQRKFNKKLMHKLKNKAKE